MNYHSLIGDMGSTLSGGQRKRIILARALYRQPQILFLDEATSHLDVDKEKVFNEAVRKLDLTKIIVAHRPETIASADRVLELRGAGSRKVSRRGVYRRPLSVLHDNILAQEALWRQTGSRTSRSHLQLGLFSG